MFKIGDFSKLSKVTVKALRYYDEIGLLSPNYVDDLTGYRYYSAVQLPRLNRILAFKDLGFSLDQVARLLDEDIPPSEVRGMLRMKQMEIQRHLNEEQERLTRVEIRLRQMEQEGKMSKYEVVIKQIESIKVASIREVIPTYGDVGKLFEELYGYLGQQQVTPAGPPISIYHDPEYREKDVDIESAAPIGASINATSRIKVHELAGGCVASTIHRGPYEAIGEAYNALMQWLETNKYRITGSPRELYLQGPMGVEPSSYVTEVQFPVDKI